MLTVAYLANEFPSAVEPYVSDEIEELRRRGVRVVSGSVRRPRVGDFREILSPQIVLGRMQLRVIARSLWMCCSRWNRVWPLIQRILFHGREGMLLRLKALLHTLLGACYAVQLERQGVEHIHVHHGYFGSWIGMTAARLLNIGFSMTLHGSDLLLHGSFLDEKLANCALCFTVSEYNRCFILDHFPAIDPARVAVTHLGVEVPDRVPTTVAAMAGLFTLVTVGRLHEVKNQEFLIEACARLRVLGVRFECFLAGEGPERKRLEADIKRLELGEQVTLLGHVERELMDSLYDRADVVVLTSRSEGIPLVLMEAMARGKIVVAPAITGIPELITHGKTGFLYEAGLLDDFVQRLASIHCLMTHRPQSQRLEFVRHAARVQVRHNFNREKRLEQFANSFVRRVAPRETSASNENPVLQQIQLPI
jgi:colanic acid/amylovoran biosynthesis glycosyltransferase